MLRICLYLATLLALALPTMAHAEPVNAARATRADLPAEGLPHVLDIALGAGYFHGEAPSLPNVDGGFAALRVRALLGGSAAYAFGLDGLGGVTTQGTLGRATLYPLGLGGRFLKTGFLALMGGIGIGGVHAMVPSAWSIPIELSMAVPIGPVRGSLWFRPAFVLDSEARKHGTVLPVFDEAELGLQFRFSRDHGYGGPLVAGRGFSLGLSGAEQVGGRSLSVLIGLDLTGGRTAQLSSSPEEAR